MQQLLEKYKRQYGYEPSVHELYALYTQGELELSDKEEDTLIRAMESLQEGAQ